MSKRSGPTLANPRPPPDVFKPAWRQRRELQNLNEQLALLQQEHAKTRNGWLYSLRDTGFLLAVFGVALLLGVGESQAKLNSNPVAITFAVMAIFTLALGLWLWFWSLRPVAENDEGHFPQVKGDCAVSRVCPNYFGAATLR